MFLRRTRQNRRVLFNRFFIDIWSNITLKKKVRNRSTRKFLQFFSRYILQGSAAGRRYSLFYKRFINKNTRKFRRRQWWLRKKRAYYNKNKKFPRVPRFSSAKKPLLKSDDFSQVYKKFLLSRLQNYLSRKPICSVNRVSQLLNLWARKKKRFYHRKVTYGWRPKRIWLLRKKDYRITDLVNLVSQQYHYGFSSLASFKSYLRKISNSSILRLGALGLEGLLCAQLFNTGILPNIRAAYNLIRSGAVLVNGYCCTNPRKFLKVSDSFMIIFPFNVVVLDFFLERLRAELIISVPPCYVEFGLRVMFFKIWRRPNKKERSWLNYYPFHRRPLKWSSVKLLGWE